ncbi:MAG TPA: PQQ-dependent dehydrogenase, methanol/ethanol family [Candidatus Limnocylindrales bacterium]|nr:PQQ-dependent dehydrogenase, methanol/ethanol family [Candidatus Limnocylindrales bacterium]
MRRQFFKPKKLMKATLSLGMICFLLSFFFVPLANSAEEVKKSEKKKEEATAKKEEVKHTEVTDEMLLNAGKDGKNWLMYGRDYTNQRYSPLNQITTANIGKLVPKWVFQTGVVHSFENTPIVVDGVMYITTPFNHVFAIDARTGKQLWKYEHKEPPTRIFCCGPNNRGVAVAYGKVYMATLDARLLALDQKTGKVVWDVETGDPTAGYGNTMAPLVYKNMVIVGTSGAEYGIRGFVKAFDAKDGKLIWTWYTIPEKGWEGEWKKTTPEGEDLHRDIEAEKKAMEKYADAWKTGGGSVWMTPALDPELGLLYVCVGNPSPDLDGSVRPGDNLYTESIVALDVNKGEMKWYYQYLPHDVWDLDATSPAVLFDVTVGGKKVKAVGHAGKTGWVYILDRTNGKLIKKSDAFVPQENMFAPPTEKGTRMLPGANGGSEWSPMAYSPQTQMVYVAGLHQPMHYIVHTAPLEKGKLWLGSAFIAAPGEEKDQYGTFTAINVNTGKIVWQHKTEQPLIGGSLATAGGLVFTGEGNGYFNAFDAKTGKLLWRFQCGAGVNAAPISFEVDGQQMIAVAAGGNFQLGFPYGDAIFVFGLSK